MINIELLKKLADGYAVEYSDKPGGIYINNKKLTDEDIDNILSPLTESKN